MTINREWTLSFCQEMQKQNLNLEWSCFSRVDRVDMELLKAMKGAGCWQICYGIETGNPESLKVINKGGKVTIEKSIQSVVETKKAGINVLGSFILGLPGEDEEMVMNTIRFAKKLAPETALFYLPIPFPGTKLYEYSKETGGLREDANWKDYIGVDFDNPVYVNPLLGKEKMTELYRLAMSQFQVDKIMVTSDSLQTCSNRSF